jgi:hypothetical protein
MEFDGAVCLFCAKQLNSKNVEMDICESYRQRRLMAWRVLSALTS